MKFEGHINTVSEKNDTLGEKLENINVADAERIRDSLVSYLGENMMLLNTFAEDTSLQYRIPGQASSFAIDLDRGEVHVPIEWFAEREYEKDQVLWACLHELAHFRELIDDLEGEKHERLHMLAKAKEMAKILEKKWEDKHGEKNPRHVENMKRQKNIPFIPGETMSDLEKQVFKYYSSFYNVLRDVFVNNYVSRKAPAFDRKVEGGQSVERLYKERLFPETDYRTQKIKQRTPIVTVAEISGVIETEVEQPLPQHLQFMYKIIREEMIPEEEAIVSEEVVEIMSRKIKYKGRTYTAQEIVSNFMKPRAGRDTKLTTRTEITSKTIEPLFDELLKKDLEGWEVPDLPPQQNENKQDEKQNEKEKSPVEDVLDEILNNQQKESDQKDGDSKEGENNKVTDEIDNKNEKDESEEGEDGDEKKEDSDDLDEAFDKAFNKEKGSKDESEEKSESSDAEEGKENSKDEKDGEEGFMQSEAGQSKSGEIEEDQDSNNGKPAKQNSEVTPVSGEASNEGEQIASSSEIPFEEYYKKQEENSIDQFDEKQIDAFIEKKEKEEEEENKKREEEERERAKSAEQKKKEFQEKLDKEFCKANKLDPVTLKDFRRIQDEVRPYMDELSHLWSHIIYGSSKESEYDVVGHFSTGSQIDIRKVIKDFPEIKKGGQEARVYKKMIEEVVPVEKPELIRVRLVGDTSGSMGGEKLETLKKVVVLMLSSLAEFNDRLARMRKQTKSKTWADTEVWKFDSDFKCIKPLAKNPEGSDEIDIIKSFTHLYAQGGTENTRVLETISESIPDEDVTKIQRGKIMDIVLEITDGVPNNPATTQVAIRALEQKGVIIRAFQIGADQYEVESFKQIWNDSLKNRGEVVGNDISQLIPAVVASLKEYLSDVRL